MGGTTTSPHSGGDPGQRHRIRTISAAPASVTMLDGARPAAAGLPQKGHLPRVFPAFLFRYRPPRPTSAAVNAEKPGNGARPTLADSRQECLRSQLAGRHRRHRLPGPLGIPALSVPNGRSFGTRDRTERLLPREPFSGNGVPARDVRNLADRTQSRRVQLGPIGEDVHPPPDGRRRAARCNCWPPTDTRLPESVSRRADHRESCTSWCGSDFVYRMPTPAHGASAMPAAGGTTFSLRILFRCFPIGSGAHHRESRWCSAHWESPVGKALLTATSPETEFGVRAKMSDCPGDLSPMDR